MSNLLFTDLAAYAATSATVGTPLEAFTHGTFRAMGGQVVQITKDDLTKLVENTRRAIEATKDESGEIVGLPIDAAQHDRKDAAGWIVGIELAGDIIKVIPRWTELGVEKLHKQLQRFFSATVDLATMTILGGSLTNWPAVRGLKPVTLDFASGLLEYALPDEALDEFARRVRNEFMEHCREMPEPCYAAMVYDNYLVADRKGKMFKVPFTDNGTSIEFAGEEQWTQVRYVPVDMSEANPQPQQEAIEVTKEELMAILDEREKARNEEAAKRLAEGTVPADLAAFVNIDKVRAEFENRLGAVLEQQLGSVQATAQQKFGEMVSQLQEDQRIRNFAASVTDGSMAGRALPVESSRIDKFLRGLPKPNRAEAEAILADVLKGGTVDFSERGVPGKAPKREVPKYVADRLTSGAITIADLSSPLMQGMLEGELAEYDLSAWKK